MSNNLQCTMTKRSYPPWPTALLRGPQPTPGFRSLESWPGPRHHWRKRSAPIRFVWRLVIEQLVTSVSWRKLDWWTYHGDQRERQVPRRSLIWSCKCIQMLVVLWMIISTGLSKKVKNYLDSGIGKAVVPISYSVICSAGVDPRVLRMSIEDVLRGRPYLRHTSFVSDNDSRQGSVSPATGCFQDLLT